MNIQRPASKVARQAKFLAALLESKGNKRKACKEAGVPESTVYRWFKADPCFCSESSEVFQRAHQALLLQRALREFSIILR